MNRTSYTNWKETITDHIFKICLSLPVSGVKVILLCHGTTNNAIFVLIHFFPQLFFFFFWERERVRVGVGGRVVSLFFPSLFNFFFLFIILMWYCMVDGIWKNNYSLNFPIFFLTAVKMTKDPLCLLEQCSNILELTPDKHEPKQLLPICGLKPTWALLVEHWFW